MKQCSWSVAPQIHVCKYVIYTLSSCEIKAWKKSRPEWAWNPWPWLLWYQCSVLPSELAYEANWELVKLWVRNIFKNDVECKWIYERPCTWTAEKVVKTWFIIAVIHNLSRCEIETRKRKDFSTQCLSCMWLQWSIVSSHRSPQFKYMVCHIHLLFAQYCIEFGMIYSTGNMKILIAAYIKGNPYKLLNSVDSEGKFLIFVNY